jgi:3-methyladenine DNA glycosylase/8-oxoguanine DNA glycosylase
VPVPRAAPTSIEVEVRPPWPYRLPRGSGGDSIVRSPRPGLACRLLHVDGQAVVAHALQRRSGEVLFRAAYAGDDAGRGREPLERAVERMRFAVGIDWDLTEFYETFKADPMIGPAVRERPWYRPGRRAWPWEALAWAVTGQLIEAVRAAEIQRRIVGRWGPRHAMRDGVLRDVPGADVIAGRAPAELAAMDLAPSRALSLIRCGHEVAAGRVDLLSGEGDARLRRIPGIGPWTMQCLGLKGRGDPDSLPAGDLAYVKLVGRMAGLGRRATVPEVEEFFAPYAPFRGLAGAFTLTRWRKLVPKGPPLRRATDAVAEAA